MKVLNGPGITHLWEQIVSYVTGLGYTSNIGTVTGVKMNNGSAISPVNGVVDLGTVVTSAPVTSVNNQTGDVTLNIPTVPSNIVTGLNSSGVATAYTIKVVDSMPDTPDSSTIYLVTEL